MTHTAYRYLETVSGIVSEGHLAELYRHNPHNFIMAYQMNNNNSIIMSVLANHDDRLYALDRGKHGVVSADSNMFAQDGTFTDLFDLIEDLKGYSWNEVMSGGKSIYDLYTRDTTTDWSVTGTLKTNTIEDYSGDTLTLSSGNDTIIGENGGSDTLIVYAGSTFSETISADSGIIIGSSGTTLNVVRGGVVSLGLVVASSGLENITHGLGTIPSWLTLTMKQVPTGTPPSYNIRAEANVAAGTAGGSVIAAYWEVNIDTIAAGTYECNTSIYWLAGA